MCDSSEQIWQKDSQRRKYTSMNTCYTREQIQGIGTRQVANLFEQVLQKRQQPKSQVYEYECMYVSQVPVQA